MAEMGRDDHHRRESRFRSQLRERLGHNGGKQSKHDRRDLRDKKEQGAGRIPPEAEHPYMISFVSTVSDPSPTAIPSATPSNRCAPIPAR